MKSYKEILEMGNALPKKDSNWFKFAEWADIGTADLDNIAADLGLTNFKKMDGMMSPPEIMKQDPRKLLKALNKYSSVKSDIKLHELSFFMKSY